MIIWREAPKKDFSTPLKRLAGSCKGKFTGSQNDIVPGLGG
jgi:hypothetical protein